VTHPWFIQWSADIEQHTGWKGRNMIDAHIVQRNYCGDSGGGGNLRKGAAPVVGLRLNIVHNHIVDAVTSPVFGSAAVARQPVAEANPTSNMPDYAVSDCNVGDLTTRTDVTTS